MSDKRIAQTACHHNLLLPEGTSPRPQAVIELNAIIVTRQVWTVPKINQEDILHLWLRRILVCSSVMQQSQDETHFDLLFTLQKAQAKTIGLRSH